MDSKNSKSKRAKKPSATAETPQDTLLIVVDKGASRFAGGEARTQKLTRSASESFARLGELLAKSSGDFWDKLKASGAYPDEVELELEVGLEAEGHWLVVSGKGSATASVRLKWIKAPKDTSGAE
jgi:hypothetical protein